MSHPARLLEAATAALDFGRAEEALGYLDELLAFDPGHDDARRLRAGLLARLPGRTADALADCARIANLTDDDHRLRARLYAQIDDPDAAVAVLMPLWSAQRHPADADMLLYLWLRRASPADLDAALTLLDSLPDTWNWRIVRGDVLAARGDRAGAAACYTAARAAVTDRTLLRYLDDRIAHLAP